VKRCSTLLEGRLGRFLAWLAAGRLPGSPEAASPEDAPQEAAGVTPVA